MKTKEVDDAKQEYKIYLEKALKRLNKDREKILLKEDEQKVKKI